MKKEVQILFYREDSTVLPLWYNLVCDFDDRLFRTYWYKLSTFDVGGYEFHTEGKTYMKVLDSANEVLYSGPILHVDDLNLRLKHVTRVDEKY